MNHTRSGVIGGGVCATVILLFCVGVLGAVEFGGGTGEPNDPYQIATAEQLIAIGSDPNLAKSHFVLTASIDLSGTTRSSPVISSFSGSLDGNEHTIRGLRARGVGSQGLFGSIEHAGQVVGLSLVDVDMIGTGTIGGLAAYNFGVIRNCHVAGCLTCTCDPAGGLVGYNGGIIRGSTCAGEISGNNRIGGLVGYNRQGLLIHCGSTAFVLGISYVGGLVGSNEGTVSASYADSEVVAGSVSGGLAGLNSGRISSCYSAGTVVGGRDVGGLVGYNSGRAYSNYSVAVITGPASPTSTTVGGLVGGTTTQTGATVDNSYFLAPADGGGPDNQLGVSLTALQMIWQANFAGWDFWGTDSDGVANHWFMPAESTPVLAWQTEITGLRWVPDVTGLSLEQAQAVFTAAGFVPGAVSHDFHRTLVVDHVIRAVPSGLAPVGGIVRLVLSSGTAYDWADNPGDGTAANPYQIQTGGQLESLTDHSELWYRSFVLTADLDMTGRTYPAAVIARDMDNVTAGFQGTSFTGVFDGQDHWIRNLVIQADGAEYAGLFGQIGQAGRVYNLHLQDASVKSKGSLAGILAGSNDGMLVDSSVIGGILIGSSCYEDGLVGEDHGTVTNCHADVTSLPASSPTFGRATR